MTRQAINIGATPNDKSGDTLRTAFTKVNQNFTEIYAALTGGVNFSQVNADWNASSGAAQILNKPALFSGSYTDLTNKPVLFSGSYTDLTNKPSIPTVPTNISSFTNDSGYLTSSSLSTYATQSYVGTQITNLIGGAPGALDTLKELADAINDNASYASSVTTALAAKAPSASPTFTGTITLPGNGSISTTAGSMGIVSPSGGNIALKSNNLANFIAVSDGGAGIAIGSNNWQFYNGGMTFPDSTTQTTAWTGVAGDKVAIGTAAGHTSQGTTSVAIGYESGQSIQGNSAIAIGNQAGQNSQGYYSIAMGLWAGQNYQGSGSIAIGSQSAIGNSSPALINVEIVDTSGNFTFLTGGFWGTIQYGQAITVTGTLTGSGSITNYTSGKTYFVISTDGSSTFQLSETHYGSAITTTPGTTSGLSFAWHQTQGQNAIAIGAQSANLNQGANAIAIGTQAGSNSQGADAVAIGSSSGYNQRIRAIAIGSGAGNQQGFQSVAIGFNSGAMAGDNSVVVGPNINSGGTGAVAIGADINGAGNNSISIGQHAMALSNAIVINATGSSWSGSFGGSRFYVAPIRSDNTPDNILHYNTTTNEISYGTVSKLINGDYTLELGSDGALTLPTDGIIKSTNNNHTAEISFLNGNLSGLVDTTHQFDFVVSGDGAQGELWLGSFEGTTSRQSGGMTVTSYGDNNFRSSEIDLYASTGNSPDNRVRISTSSTANGSHEWLFQSDGNLQFPDGATYNGSTLVLPESLNIEAGLRTYIQTNNQAHAWVFWENGVLTVPTSQYGTGQVFAPESISLCLGNSSHFIQVRGTDGAVVLPNGATITPHTAGLDALHTAYTTAVSNYATVQVSDIQSMITNNPGIEFTWPFAYWNVDGTNVQGYIDIVNEAWTVQNAPSSPAVPLIFVPAISASLHNQILLLLNAINNTYIAWQAAMSSVDITAGNTSMSLLADNKLQVPLYIQGVMEEDVTIRARHVGATSPGSGQVEIDKDFIFGTNGYLTVPAGIVFADGSHQTTAWKLATPPTHSYGSAGDTTGMVAFDSNFIYYCKQDYVDNSTNIWVRVAWTGTTW